MEKKVDDVPYRHIGVSAVCRTERYQTNHKQEKHSSRMRTCENITLPQTLFAGGKSSITYLRLQRIDILSFFVDGWW